MNYVKVLGVWLLLGIGIAGPYQAFAESATSDTQIEAVSTEETLKLSEDDKSGKEQESSSQENTENETEIVANPEKQQKATNELKIWAITFDSGRNQLLVKTEPNAKVNITSSYGQGVFQADAEGNLVAEGNFEADTIVYLTAMLDGVSGETYEYTIPTQAVIDSLKITTISYDHSTKTLTAKTAANAKVNITSSYGQGVFQTDAEGNLVAEGNFESGTIVYLTAMLDSVSGETYEYTIPAAPSVDSTEPSIERTDGSISKKGFPKTGATVNIALSVVGGLLVLVVAVWVIRNKFIGKR